MPYSGASDKTLPPAVRKLPKALREVWVRVFNEHYDENEEATAYKLAWGAVRKIQSAKEARLAGYQDMDDLVVWLKGEKALKTEGESKFAAAAYLFHGDVQKPSTWKLRIEEEPGKVTAAQLGRAAAALGPGFRGNQVEMSASDRRKCAQQLIKHYRILDVPDADIPDYLWGLAGQPKPGSKARQVPFSFQVKETPAGALRWTMLSSGAFEDRDGQIMSTAFLESALQFAEMTGYRGTLNFWHVKNSDIGVCDYQALVGEPPLLIESGTFDDTPAGRLAAEYYRQHASEKGGSIEFYAADLTEDGVFMPPGVIARRSVLPARWAAFPWSGLSVKESLMAKKHAELVAEFAEVFQMTADQAEATIAALEADTQTLKDWNIRWKELAQEPTPDASPAPAAETPVAEEPSAEAVAVSEPAVAASAPEPLAAEPTAMEVVLSPETITGVLEQVRSEFAGVLKGLEERIATLVATVTTVTEQQLAANAVTKELQNTVTRLQRTDDEKVQERVSHLPRAVVKSLQPPAVRPTQREPETKEAETLSQAERAYRTLHGDK